MEKRKATGRFQRRRTLRLTAEKDERPSRQVKTTGISVSEYMRRFFSGGQAIIHRTDAQSIRELRRLGGLLKHYFEMVKRAGYAGALVGLDAAVTLHLRCAGILPGEAANEIFRHTPARPHGQDRAKRIGYCRRLTGYAFGTVGDIDLAAVRPTLEQI